MGSLATIRRQLLLHSHSIILLMNLMARMWILFSGETGAVTVMSLGMIMEDELLPRIFIQEIGITEFVVLNYPVIVIN